MTRDKREPDNSQAAIDRRMLENRQLFARWASDGSDPQAARAALGVRSCRSAIRPEPIPGEEFAAYKVAGLLPARERLRCGVCRQPIYRIRSPRGRGARQPWRHGVGS